MDDLISAIGKRLGDYICDLTNVFINSIASSDELEELGNSIRKAILSIAPSDEVKERIVKSLERWGDFGWCVMDWASIDLYHTTPSSVYEADEMAMKYCTEKEVTVLLESIATETDMPDLFNEAVWCYNNEKFTSCSLLLFSIIDSMMIRLQDKIDNKHRRDLANKMAENLQESITDHKDFLSFASLLAMINAVKVLFKPGNDFTNESRELINRNFVSHGMNARQVTKIDCIKLFVIINALIKNMKVYNITFKSHIISLEASEAEIDIKEK